MKELNLQSIARGKAASLFEGELEKVLDNISDPETSSEFNRKIVLEFTFTPEEDRSVKIKVKSASRLAPRVAPEAKAWIDKAYNHLYEDNPDQCELFSEETESDFDPFSEMKTEDTGCILEED